MSNFWECAKCGQQNPVIIHECSCATPKAKRQQVDQAMEVYRELRKDLGMIIGLTMIIHFAWLYLLAGKDATDPPHGRSGMSLRIDAETGLHYLEGRGGVLTPRLDANGNHMMSSR